MVIKVISGLWKKESNRERNSSQTLRQVVKLIWKKKNKDRGK